MKAIGAAFISALLFGIGLGVSGMTLPSKVIGFLDITGQWDPSLLWVMIGAIAVHALSYRWIVKQERPKFNSIFAIPQRRDIDWKLVVGAAVFGIGWGLAGICPGPALVDLASGKIEVLNFVLGMIGGVYLFRLVDKFLISRRNLP